MFAYRGGQFVELTEDLVSGTIDNDEANQAQIRVLDLDGDGDEDIYFGRYRMQENAFGGLSRSAKARLVAAAEESGRSGGKVPRVRTDRTIKPGTKFLREWNGRTHEVMALADGGFVYRGTVYRSLSAIAREITGTRWSGPVFFGLEAGRGANGRAQGAAHHGERGPGSGRHVEGSLARGTLSMKRAGKQAGSDRVKSPGSPAVSQFEFRSGPAHNSLKIGDGAICGSGG